MGVKLPSDYKNFIDMYGAGSVCSAEGDFASINIWNYRGVSNVRDWAASATRRYNDDLLAGHKLPYVGYPNMDGILAWGSTPAGDFFNWRMRGKPNDWDVVFYHCSSAKMILLESHSFLRVVLDLLRQQSPLVGRMLSIDCFAPPCRFTAENW